ncbi:hypothetical protein [Actinoplanes sp. NPDC026670]|uniref:hypothetical protein n=1 Tax=Actinoplanes sp. NPDC026670 TaxID=3154700 RepID=UPI003401F123
MSKHRSTVTGTARVATNLVVRQITSVSELAAAPVGAVIRDAQGDQHERLALGMWRSNALAHRLTDEELAQYLPATFVNHDEIVGFELDGIHLGDLVRITGNEYARIVGAGQNGVVERIVGEFLYVRFKGGMVTAVKPEEVEPVELAGDVKQYARVRVAREAGFAHGPLGPGAEGIVLGKAVGAYVEPSWVVRVEGDSPWFGHVQGWIYPESALQVITV